MPVKDNIRKVEGGKFDKQTKTLSRSAQITDDRKQE